MSLSSLSFNELMERVRSGCPEAFQAVMSTYGDAIQREIRFTLLDAKVRRIHGDSDVFQSVVMRFYAGMHDGRFELQSPEDLTRLLKGIVRMRVAELVRRWHAQRRDVSRAVPLDGIVQDSLANPELTADQRTENAELAGMIRDLLPERSMEVIQLRDQGQSWEEIASQLDAPSANALRKQHERALAKVAAVLERRESGSQRTTIR